LVAPETVASVVMEPVQGEGGFIIPPKKFVQAVSVFCKEHGIVFVADEIQTGFGRAGKMFGFEHFGIIPDIVTMAKGLGGGMPIGAFSAPKNIMDALSFDPPLGHITTFGGHPVSCAAAYANIEVLKTLSFSDIEAKGQKLTNALTHPLVLEIRRIGMFFAIEMTNSDVVQKVVEGCMSKGLISFWFLSCPSAFRIAPPLNITDEELDKSIEILRTVFNEVNTDLLKA